MNPSNRGKTKKAHGERCGMKLLHQDNQVTQEGIQDWTRKNSRREN
jgi:hypothetical protein